MDGTWTRATCTKQQHAQLLLILLELKQLFQQCKDGPRGLQWAVPEP